MTLIHTQPGVADQFIQDFIKCTNEIMKTPTAKCGGQVGTVILLFIAENNTDRRASVELIKISVIFA